MRRRLFTLLSALSLLLCITTALLWVWSYAAPKRQTNTAAPTMARHRELALGDGYVGVSTIQWFNPPASAAAFPGYPYGAEVGGWNVMGLQWRDERMTLWRPGDRKVVMVLNRSTVFSVWLGVPFLLSAVLPAWWWMNRMREINRTKRKGTCRVCGYDLRATRERCPECGTVVTLP